MDACAVRSKGDLSRGEGRLDGRRKSFPKPADAWEIRRHCCATVCGRDGRRLQWTGQLSGRRDGLHAAAPLRGASSDDAGPDAAADACAAGRSTVTTMGEQRRRARPRSLQKMAASAAPERAGGFSLGASCRRWLYVTAAHELVVGHRARAIPAVERLRQAPSIASSSHHRLLP